MGWLFKNLLRLLVLGAIAFAVYAFFAELPPPTEKITVDLEPPAGQSGSATQPAAESGGQGEAEPAGEAEPSGESEPSGEAAETEETSGGDAN